MSQQKKSLSNFLEQLHNITEANEKINLDNLKNYYLNIPREGYQNIDDFEIKNDKIILKSSSSSFKRIFNVDDVFKLEGRLKKDKPIRNVKNRNIYFSLHNDFIRFFGTNLGNQSFDYFYDDEHVPIYTFTPESYRLRTRESVKFYYTNKTGCLNLNLNILENVLSVFRNSKFHSEKFTFKINTKSNSFKKYFEPNEIDDKYFYFLGKDFIQVNKKFKVELFYNRSADLLCLTNPFKFNNQKAIHHSEKNSEFPTLFLFILDCFELVKTKVKVDLDKPVYFKYQDKYVPSDKMKGVFTIHHYDRKNGRVTLNGPNYKVITKLKNLRNVKTKKEST